jgi:NAD+--dinitrogen-reductase ADP-D-ribosyltransferase
MIDLEHNHKAGVYYHSTNKINIPAKLFISKEYNKGVIPITIDGVLEYHMRLFESIALAGSITQASVIFESYMSQLFELEERVHGKKVGSYIRLLKSWLFDSNNSAGAVLKGWVENRFGLIPFFHAQPIPGLYSKEYYDYLQEMMNSRTNKNSMFSQLDLLYTYTQTIIKAYKRNHLPTITLYRGVNDLNDHFIIERYSKRKYCIELNSLSSFTCEKEIAEQFGSRIFKIDVPYTKIIYFSDALPMRAFSGELEYLVMGGRYDVEIVP